jgi:phosphoenolpyruvate carboxylase
MELYEKGIIDQIEVLKQTEVVDMEGVMNRFGEIQQLRQQVAGLTQQLKGVQGDLQTAQRESVQDRKRVEVEKFKTGLHSVRNRAEGAQELFKARLNDQLSNQEKAAKVEMQRRKMPPKK